MNTPGRDGGTGECYGTAGDVGVSRPDHPRVDIETFGAEGPLSDEPVKNAAEIESLETKTYSQVE